MPLAFKILCYFLIALALIAARLDAVEEQEWKDAKAKKEKQEKSYRVCGKQVPESCVDFTRTN